MIVWKREGRTSWFVGALVSDGEMTARSAIHYRFGFCCALLYLAASAVFPLHVLAWALDQLSDLTDKAAQTVVTLKGPDNLNSEYPHDVSVKNLSSDPLVGETLIIVLDKITNFGGDEWMAGTSESNLTRMEILGQDGETDDCKPYFRIPRGSAPDLPPTTKVVLLPCGPATRTISSYSLRFFVCME